MVDQSRQNWFEPMISAPNLEAITKINSEFADATRDAGKACLDGMIEFQSDLLQFADQRVKEDSNTGLHALQAGDFSGLVEAQQSWVNRTIEQYGSQAEKWLELSQRMAKIAWSPMFTYEKNVAEEASRNQSAQAGNAEQGKNGARKPNAKTSN